MLRGSGFATNASLIIFLYFQRPPKHTQTAIMATFRIKPK